MKLLPLFLSALFMSVAVLPVQAAEQSTAVTVERVKQQPACHSAEGRKTEYCQNVMFPPIPFR